MVYTLKCTCKTSQLTAGTLKTYVYAHCMSFMRTKWQVGSLAAAAALHSAANLPPQELPVVMFAGAHKVRRRRSLPQDRHTADCAGAAAHSC
jgi:hypothetical protein